ncbi:MAG: hypothetical protein ACREOP_05665, partial [Thermodesulfobacteriota bacterium]
KTAEEIFGEYKNGRIELGSYRGRSCYSAPAQAAEYFLRKETGIRKITAFYLRGMKVENEEIQVDFQSAHDEKIFNVKLRRLDNAFKILKSCGDKERSFIPLFRLIRIEEV